MAICFSRDAKEFVIKTNTRLCVYLLTRNYFQPKLWAETSCGSINTGLYEMIVGVLTTCHAQYT